MTTATEDERERQLLLAQAQAEELFRRVESSGILRAGATESQINEEVYQLAWRDFGVKVHWHKRIVRAGANTLMPYAENPPDLVIQEDDILFLDFGPVFEQWEADFGRTFVIGNDPWKRKLQRDIGEAFLRGKQYFHSHRGITAAELFAYARELARESGWEFGGSIAGHLIGQFPHERIPEDKISLYVHPHNPLRMRDPGADGKPRHWILEIHFVDRKRQIGGFYEELLTLG